MKKAVLEGDSLVVKKGLLEAERSLAPLVYYLRMQRIFPKSSMSCFTLIQRGKVTLKLIV